MTRPTRSCRQNQPQQQTIESADSDDEPQVHESSENENQANNTLKKRGRGRPKGSKNKPKDNTKQPPSKKSKTASEKPQTFNSTTFEARGVVLRVVEANLGRYGGR